MNPLTILPLLAVAMAAPGAIFTNGVVGPAVTYHAGAVVAQPAVASYQVPLTKTVHYENRPVVTGYQTTVLKPAIAQAPIVAGLSYQFPPITPPPQLAPPNSTEIPSAPPSEIPSLAPPTQPPAGGDNSSSSDQGGQMPVLPIPGSPISLFHNNHFGFNPIQLPLSVAPQSVVVQQPIAQTIAQPADAIVVEARSAAVPVAAPVAVAPVQVAAVRAAQAGDFEPLVTKEKVLAPVRAHTQITPQLTQIQPEITVRKVVQEVPVATPVFQTPVVQQVVQPQAYIAGQQIVQQPFVGQQFLGQQFVGQPFVGQQFVSGARVVV